MNKSTLKLINLQPLKFLSMTLLSILTPTKTRGPYYPSINAFRHVKSVAIVRSNVPKFCLEALEVSHLMCSIFKLRQQYADPRGVSDCFFNTG